MWRFILVSFAFLGWSFYALSGGSDYEPRANSLQKHGAQEDARPALSGNTAVTTADAAHTGEADNDSVTRSAASLADLNLAETENERFEISLASVSPSNEYEADNLPETVEVETVSAIDAAVAEANSGLALAEKAKVEAAEQEEAALNPATGDEVFSLETYVQSRGADVQADDTAYAGEIISASSRGDDIREVTGKVVNMRAGPGTDFATVGTLSRGDRIAVLDEPGNGWLMFEVVETGETGWMADWLVTASN